MHDVIMFIYGMCVGAMFGGVAVAISMMKLEPLGDSKRNER